MSMLELGSIVTMTMRVTDNTGTLVDPASPPTFVATHADGVTTSGTLSSTKASTGIYYVDWPTTATGRWTYVGTATLTGGGTVVVRDVFEVVDSTTTSILSVPDAASCLNLDLTADPDQYVPQLRDFVAGITRVIESIVGPILVAQVDEWLDGGGPFVYLSKSPVVSVTSVQEVIGTARYTLTQQDPGGTVDSFGYSIDYDTGKLIRRVSGISVAWAYGKNNVHVVYKAGRTSTAANIRQAALDLLRVNYVPQQVGNLEAWTSSGVNNIDVEGSYRMGFFVPNRVMEQLMPDVQRAWAG